MWRLGEFKPILRLRHPSTIDRVLYSPSGLVIATSTWAFDTHFWDAGTGKQLLVVNGKLGSFSADGKRLSYSQGTKLGFWELADGNEQLSVRDTSVPSAGKVPLSMTMHPSGNIAVLCLMSGLRICDLENRQFKDILMQPCFDARFNAAGDELFTANGIRVWKWPFRVDRDRQTVTVGPPVEIATEGKKGTQEVRIDIDQHGDVLCVARRDKVFVYKLSSNVPPREIKTFPNARGVSTCIDGRLVAVGNHHGNMLAVFDGKSGERLFSIDTPSAARVELSPDGNLLAATYSTRLEVYDTSNRTKLYEIRDLDVAWPCTFSADQKTLVASIREDNAVLLIESATGRRLAQFPIETGRSPRSVPGVLSVNNDRLVTLTRFNGIAIWDLLSVRRQLRELQLDWDIGDMLTEDRSEPWRPMQIQIELGDQALPFVQQATSGLWGRVGREATFEMLDQAIAENGMESTHLIARSDLLFKLHRFPEALVDINKAIKANREMAAAYRLRARIYDILGERVKAAADLKRVVELDPADTETLARFVHLQAVFSPEFRDVETSLKFADRCLELEKNRLRAQKASQVANFWAGRDETVTKIYSQISSNGGLDSGTHMTAALSYHRLGNESAAQAAWQAAKEVIREAKNVTSQRYAVVLALFDECQRVFQEQANDRNEFVFEAKRLASIARPDQGRLWVQRMTPNDRSSSDWSENQQLLWECSEPGHDVVFTFEVAEPGEFELDLSATSDTNFGKFQVRLNGNSVGDRVDGFSDAQSLTTVSLGIVGLRRGKNELSIQMVDKHPRSKGYQAGIDWIRFRRHEPAADSSFHQNTSD